MLEPERRRPLLNTEIAGAHLPCCQPFHDRGAVRGLLLHRHGDEPALRLRPVAIFVAMILDALDGRWRG